MTRPMPGCRPRCLSAHRASRAKRDHRWSRLHDLAVAHHNGANAVCTALRLPPPWSCRVARVPLARLFTRRCVRLVKEHILDSYSEFTNSIIFKIALYTSVSTCCIVLDRVYSHWCSSKGIFQISMVTSFFLERRFHRFPFSSARNCISIYPSCSFFSLKCDFI